MFQTQREREEEREEGVKGEEKIMSSKNKHLLNPSLLYTILTPKKEETYRSIFVLAKWGNLNHSLEGSTITLANSGMSLFLLGLWTSQSLIEHFQKIL